MSTSILCIKEFGAYKVCKVKEANQADEELQVHRKDDDDEQKIISIYRLPERPRVPLLQDGATPSAHREWLDKNVHYRSTDIVIATHPRSGTTLTEQIVLLLLNHGDISRTDPLLQNTYTRSTPWGKVWTEAVVVPEEWLGEGLRPPESPVRNPNFLLSCNEFNALPAPRVLKTHASGKEALSCHDVDGRREPAPAKYIVVTRNIFDTCVSGYYHGINAHANGWPFDAWSLHFLYNEKPQMIYGLDYLEWHASWKALDIASNSNNATFLWIHYEDLLQSPKESIAKIAHFIGTPMDETLLDKVVEGSSFASMKAQAKESAQNLAPKAAARRVSSYRKGKIGDWRSHFTPELEELFRQEYKKKLGSYGLQYDLGNGEILK